MVVADALVPLASVLVGAAITYWLNVRDRRRTRVEELFARAIGAVAAAEVAQHYSAGWVRPNSVTEQDHAAALSQYHRDAALHYFALVAEARELVAEASAYRPSLDPFARMLPDAFVLQSPQLIAELRAGPTDR